MTDADYAAVLRRFVVNQHTADDYVQDAIERAIELLEREADAQDAFESGAYQ